MHHVYVIKSMVDGRLYKGMSTNIDLRVKAHNAGKVRATKGYRPWKLVHQESFESEEEARIRELYLKSGAGRDFLRSLGL